MNRVRRTLAAAIGAVVVGAACVAVLSTSAGAADPPCPDQNAPGTYTACVTDPGGGTGGTGDTGGTGGTGGSGGSGGSGGTGTPDPCVQYPDGFYTLCTKNQGEACLIWYDEYEGNIANIGLYALFDKFTVGDFNEFMTINNCPTIVPSRTPAHQAPPTPAQLARTAWASITVPNPSGHLSPNENLRLNGSAYSYVNLWTYFWTDATPFNTHISATGGTAPGLTVTVTAVPTLSFDPGDGSAAVHCNGPGRAWTMADGFDLPSGACAYRYTKVTGPGSNHPLTASEIINWQVTWKASDGTSGSINATPTTTSVNLNVLQIQSVVCQNTPCR